MCGNVELVSSVFKNSQMGVVSITKLTETVKDDKMLEELYSELAEYKKINSRAAEKLRSLGEEESAKLYMHVEPGVYPDYPNGQKGDTHTRRAGAEAYARMTAESLKKLNLI